MWIYLVAPACDTPPCGPTCGFIWWPLCVFVTPLWSHMWIYQVAPVSAPPWSPTYGFIWWSLCVWHPVAPHVDLSGGPCVRRPLGAPYVDLSGGPCVYHPLWPHMWMYLVAPV